MTEQKKQLLRQQTKSSRLKARIIANLMMKDVGLTNTIVTPTIQSCEMKEETQIELVKYLTQMRQMEFIEISKMKNREIELEQKRIG